MRDIRGQLQILLASVSSLTEKFEKFEQSVPIRPSNQKPEHCTSVNESNVKDPLKATEVLPNNPNGKGFKNTVKKTNHWKSKLLSNFFYI